MKEMNAMSEKGWSEKRTDFFGDEYVQHFDEDGNEAGWSQTKEGFSGEYTQHHDNDGNEVGWSEEKDGVLVDQYTQHYDNDNNEVGWSEEKEGVLVDCYSQHYDSDNNETGWSEEKRGVLVDRYTQHHGRATGYASSSTADRRSSSSEASSSDSLANDWSSTDPSSRSVAASYSDGSGVGLGVLLLAAIGLAVFLQSMRIGPPNASSPVPVAAGQPVPAKPGTLWDQSTPLSLHSISLDEVSLSADGSIVGDAIIISQPLRYADRDVPHDAVWSSTSATGRYRFVTLCDLDWCNDARLIDRQRERIAHVHLTDVGASAGVAWSPDDRYALIKWSHAGTSGVIALDLESLATTGTSRSLPSSIFSDEPGNIGDLPKGVKPESPSLRFDLNTAVWLDQRMVELDVEVVKTVWTTVDGNSGAGSPESAGSARLRFSVPSLEAVLVGRTLPPDAPAGNGVDSTANAPAEPASEIAHVGELPPAPAPGSQPTTVPQEPVVPPRL
jgi:hypothetical protein